jgi:hypothetical protein
MKCRGLASWLALVHIFYITDIIVMSSEKGDCRMVIEDKDTNEPSPSQQHNSNVVAPSVVKLSPAARAALPISATV